MVEPAALDGSPHELVDVGDHRLPEAVPGQDEDRAIVLGEVEVVGRRGVLHPEAGIAGLGEVRPGDRVRVQVGEPHTQGGSVLALELELEHVAVEGGGQRGGAGPDPLGQAPPQVGPVRDGLVGPHEPLVLGDRKPVHGDEAVSRLGAAVGEVRLVLRDVRDEVHRRIAVVGKDAHGSHADGPRPACQTRGAGHAEPAWNETDVEVAVTAGVAELREGVEESLLGVGLHELAPVGRHRLEGIEAPMLFLRGREGLAGRRQGDDRVEEGGAELRRSGPGRGLLAKRAARLGQERQAQRARPPGTP